MKYPQFTIDEILAVLRRRKKVFLTPVIFISTACILGAFILPQKYESSITILVQRDAVLNPLISYTMAVTTASDNRLRDFNEIIFSRPTIEALIDSIGLKSEYEQAADKNKYIEKISKNLETNLSGSDSYTITCFDVKPEATKKAVTVLSELFIRKRLEVDNKRNELAVEFFQKKLDELKAKFEQSKEGLITVLKQQMNELPAGDRMLYSHVDEFDTKIGELDDRVKTYRNALNIINSIPLNSDYLRVLKSLYDISLLDVPYAAELQTTLKSYDALSQKYTQSYPQVQDAESQITDLLTRIKHSIETELNRKQKQSWSLEQQRNAAISTIRTATISENQNQDVKSTYDVYSKLYNDMKVKLEQAITTRDLGEKGAEQFVVINPPLLPTSPSKPNKLLLIGGGISLAFFLGFLAAGLTELFDTRIRTSRDVDIYEKPILAYLPAPGFEKEN